MIQATLHNACEQDTLSDCVQSLLPETRFVNGGTVWNIAGFRFSGFAPRHCIYEKNGFRLTGEKRIEDEVIPLLKMERVTE